MVVRNVYRRASAGVLVALLTALAALTAASPAAARISPSDVGGGEWGPYCYEYYPTSEITCSVHEPVVNQPATTYSIRVPGGRHIHIDAGGCVQTGGHGKTWKRYVDPISGKGLYHGLIDIPGVTNGLQQLQGLVGGTYEVHGDGGFVVLGYQDDGYSDNGYYAHDDGTSNQCRNSVNAWVHLDITR
jgi:hypothetical protein